VKASYRGSKERQLSRTLEKTARQGGFFVSGGLYYFCMLKVNYVIYVT